MPENRTERRPLDPSPDDDLCVGVVVRHDQNRALLTEWLADTYDVIAPADGDLSAVTASADLLLLDEGAYERHADWVGAYRNSEASLFRPVLLLVDDDRVGGHGGVWATVDDVVTVPVEKAVLHARIRGLLSRRALSRELAASEDRFRALFDLGPDPAIVLEADDRVVDSNAAFRDLVGVADDCHGRSIDSFDAFGEDAVETMSTPHGEPGSGRVFPFVAGGERRYAECRTRDLDTEPDRRLLILRDVTERIRHERELQRQVDRLDEFAGVLAHEMRNPLSIATGWLGQAEETGDPDAFERVAAAHTRMNEMIEELLQLARQGSVIGDRSTVSMTALVDDAWASVATADATLCVDSALSERTVTCDPARVEELFANLFRNAVEHGSADDKWRDQEDDVDDGDGVAVEVGVTEDGRGVYVADDGPGLGGVDRDQLFESGYTTADHGTGFGLAIVKQVADAHGWTVRTADGDRGGARFELRGALDVDDATGEGA